MYYKNPCSKCMSILYQTVNSFSHLTLITNNQSDVWLGEHLVNTLTTCNQVKEICKIHYLLYHCSILKLIQLDCFLQYKECTLLSKIIPEYNTLEDTILFHSLYVRCSTQTSVYSRQS